MKAIKLEIKMMKKPKIGSFNLRRHFTSLCCIALVLTFSSCYYDSEEYLYGVEECATEISYSADVAPIIQQNCAVSGCHADIQSPILNTVADIQNNATNIVVRVENGTMPPIGPLTEEQVQKISCWVEQGALDN